MLAAYTTEVWVTAIAPFKTNDNRTAERRAKDERERLLDNSLPDRPDCGLCSIGNTNLSENVLNVLFDRFITNL